MALTDLASLQRELYRLTNTDSADDAMTEHDNTALEGVNQLLQDGADDAQLFLLDAGVGEQFWVKETPDALIFRGSDPNKYASLPADFMRLGGDEWHSALYKADTTQDRWGRLIGLEQKLRRTGKYYYLTALEESEVHDPFSNFSDSSLWTLQNGWAITEGVKLNGTGAGTVETATATLLGYGGLEPVYVTYTVSNRTAGSVTVSVGGTSGTLRNTNGTFSEWIVPAATTGSPSIVFTLGTASGNFDGDITGLSVWMPGLFAVRLVRASNPPSNLKAQYIRKIKPLEANRGVDFPAEYRSLITAFAANRATSQSWFVGDQREIQMLQGYLMNQKQDAWRRARMSRQPKMATPHPMVGDHWIT